MNSPVPGVVVGGKYRILRCLGEGGMGAVYEAENSLTLKRAAIKWLHPRLAASEDAGKRLLHEARATARIRHRNVVDIYDVVLEESSLFLVMELLIGEPLGRRLASHSLEMWEVVGLLLPAMQGVAAAHAAGVVHRDIKPDNIFLASEGEGEVPKVIDFGISRIFEAGGSRLTLSGMTMGTPRYVSYEQLCGVRDVDPRADVYAFGVILYECLVGQPPYDATTFGEQAISFITTQPPAPHQARPDVPEPLSALVQAASEKDRDRRTPSMAELIARLEPYADKSRYPTRLMAISPRASHPPTPYAMPPQTTTPETLMAPEPIATPVSPSLPDLGRRRRLSQWLALSAALLAGGAASSFWVWSEKTGDGARPSARPRDPASPARAPNAVPNALQPAPGSDPLEPLHGRSANAPREMEISADVAAQEPVHASPRPARARRAAAPDAAVASEPPRGGPLRSREDIPRSGLLRRDEF